VGDIPTFEGSSHVSDVTVNGVPVDLAAPLEQIGTGLNGSPLGGLIRITFDESEESPDGLVRRAVHVMIRNSAGEVIYEAVAGEAKVSRREAVCDSQGTSSLQCPAGFLPAGDGSCLPTGPVADADQPIGGAYVPLDQVPGAGKSICRGRGFGPALVAIMGTNRRDDVTGTNKSDRIFVLRGRDAVSGGRGNDCIEGGPHMNRLDGSTGGDFLLGHSSKDALMGGSNADRLFGRGGRDRADGGLGNDYLSGGRGRDHLAGGPGHDRLNGGPGRDFIDAGTGRDRVNAGTGNDVINAANEGPPTRLRCGPGRDTVRINAAEVRFLRSCERVFVTQRR
jgi:hypothetical protein